MGRVLSVMNVKRMRRWWSIFRVAQKGMRANTNQLELWWFSHANALQIYSTACVASRPIKQKFLLLCRVNYIVWKDKINFEQLANFNITLRNIFESTQVKNVGAKMFTSEISELLFYLGISKYFRLKFFVLSKGILLIERSRERYLLFPLTFK